MAISVQQFCAAYPTLYHMAEVNSWPSIVRHGLLSATALLDLFEVTGGQRSLIESTRRANSVALRHPVYGNAVLRDQKPLRESVLRRLLLDCTTTEWLRFLNRKVFFWTTEERVSRLLNARAFRGSEHIVISVDARSMLRTNEGRVLLSPINSGSTLFGKVSRGLFMFQPLATYPSALRKEGRDKKDSIAEVIVDYAIPHVLHVVFKVERRKQTAILETLYSRSSGSSAPVEGTP